jgi:nucleoid-associated protein YgaU
VVRWPEIFEVNRDRMQNPALIVIGQALRIPRVLQFHVVQRGDTLRRDCSPRVW